jgi:alkanesulfonate monooxygenase SsuD/methylene tetrahydromethanopterin reductase-like flavin-dependent oxidoreductase (luciferase family)
VLETLPAAGGRVLLTEDQAQAWLRSLNDVRIALGVRLDVTEDRDEMLDRADQGGKESSGLLVYDWLSLLQSTLVQAIW